MSRKRLVGIIFVVIGCILLVRYRGVLSTIADIILIAVGFKLIISGKIVKKQPPADIALQIVSQLPNSSTLLSKKNVKKIHRLFPVPNDYDILWAEVLRFGNKPAGIIITNEALILKALPSEINKQNAEIKKENKGKPKKDRKAKIPYIYRLIPWEYFSPSDFRLEVKTVKGENEYTLCFDEKNSFQFLTPTLFIAFEKMQKSYSQMEGTLNAIEVSTLNAALNTIQVEPALYMAKNGAANTPTGHGILAEDVGTLLDKFSGHDATVVGRNNASNGPDKLINIDGYQTAVQCKYCKSADSSVNDCFENGSFRYFDLNDNPMQIEVPKDQYYKAIEEMKNKIQTGQVHGVSDPEQAYNIIRQGNITYNQAKNLAKAGTFESITYDTATAVVRCTSVFGISFLIVFAQVAWATKDYKKAAKCALITGAKIYGLSVLGSIISSQLARSNNANFMYPVINGILKELSPQIVGRMSKTTQGFVNPGVASIDGARSYYAKFLSAQVSTTLVMFFITSTPDIYRVISNEISKGQFVMNMAEKFAGIVTGTLTGSVVGTTIGTVANPIAGGIAGMTTGAVIGSTASLIVHNFCHLFREDDAVIIGRMFTAFLINSAMDYMLSQDEQERLVKMLKEDQRGLSRLQKKIMKSRTQSRLIKKYLSKKIEIITKGRKKLNKENEAMIYSQTNAFIHEGEVPDAM